MKVGKQCILKSKQTKRWTEPRYSHFKRRNYIQKCVHNTSLQSGQQGAI